MNWLTPLARTFPQFRALDLHAYFVAHGRNHEQAMLADLQALDFSPQVILFSILEDKLNAATLRAIRAQFPHAVMLNWFADDEWRYEIWSKYWAPLFDVAATTHVPALADYATQGIPAVFASWAYNPDTFYKMPAAEKRYDVVFVGLHYGDRSQLINQLLAAGLDVHVWGKGWDGKLSDPSKYHGFASSSDLVRLMNEARIVLNFTKDPYLQTTTQVKARIFETAGCGTFQLMEHVDGLERLFPVATDELTFRDSAELLQKVIYFLEHADERERIALAMYERAVSTHTWDRRFAELFGATATALAAQKIETKPPAVQQAVSLAASEQRDCNYALLAPHRIQAPLRLCEFYAVDEAGEKFLRFSLRAAFVRRSFDWLDWFPRECVQWQSAAVAAQAPSLEAQIRAGHFEYCAIPCVHVPLKRLTITLEQRALFQACDYYEHTVNVQPYERFVIYGTGTVGLRFHTYLTVKLQKQVVAFVDSSEAKWGTQLHGLPVWSPAQLQAQRATHPIAFERIIIASSFVEPIVYALEKLGFQTDEHLLIPYF
jgi:spore maturation protein CgeB